MPDYQQMSRLRYEVQKAISRNMHYAGLSIPAEQVQVSEPTTSEDVTFDLLRGIDLFDSLIDTELEQLQQTMSETLVLKKTEVVVEGDDGVSLFIVKEGLLEVSKASFEPIIKARPEIAEVLSRTIEFRNQQNETENNRQLQGEVSGDRPLLARIRDFFSLNNGDGMRSSALN